MPRFLPPIKSLPRSGNRSKLEIITLFFLRRNHHHHLTAFHFREGFDLGYFRQILFTRSKVAHRVAGEPFHVHGNEVYFDFITVSQEAVDVAHFDLIIAFIGTRTEFDFLNLYLLLVFSWLRRVSWPAGIYIYRNPSVCIQVVWQ